MAHQKIFKERFNKIFNPQRKESSVIIKMKNLEQEIQERLVDVEKRLSEEHRRYKIDEAVTEADIKWRFLNNFHWHITGESFYQDIVYSIETIDPKYNGLNRSEVEKLKIVELYPSEKTLEEHSERYQTATYG